MAKNCCVIAVRSTRTVYVGLMLPDKQFLCPAAPCGCRRLGCCTSLMPGQRAAGPRAPPRRRQDGVVNRDVWGGGAARCAHELRQNWSLLPQRAGVLILVGSFARVACWAKGRGGLLGVIWRVGVVSQPWERVRGAWLGEGESTEGIYS